MSPSHAHRATEVCVQRLTQHGERPEALDPPQAWLDVQEGRGEPTLLLIGGAPPIHLVGPLPEEGIEREGASIFWGACGGIRRDVFLALGVPLYRFFIRDRGLRFCMQDIPWHWFYYLDNGLAFTIGPSRYPLRRAWWDPGKHARNGADGR